MTEESVIRLFASIADSSPDVKGGGSAAIHRSSRFRLRRPLPAGEGSAIFAA